jgi:hypothetical protein
MRLRHYHNGHSLSPLTPARRGNRGGAITASSVRPDYISMKLQTGGSMAEANPSKEDQGGFMEATIL